jgi:hypothetical protein
LLDGYNYLKAEVDNLKRKSSNDNVRRNELSKLKKEIRSLKRDNVKLLDKHKRVCDALDKVLTVSQRKILVDKRKKVKWDDKSMSIAFALRYLSYRSYVYLKRNLNYPLPALSTLRRWASSLQMRQGVLEDVFTIMEIAGRKQKPHERVVVLQFDEVKIKTTHEYDVQADEILGPHSQMQVVLARGLFGKWKQPIFVDFDTNITDTILNGLTSKLNGIGYKVVACVSDMGASNRGLWKQLGVSKEKPWYPHPDDGQRIHFFADTPHLLKLIRNWLLDTGFKLENGSVIHKGPLVELVKQDSGEYQACFKLSEAHINCVKSQRQSVKLAAQLLSHTTATALKRYKPGINSSLCDNLAKFIAETNDWFDVMNSHIVDVFGFPCKGAYGLHEHQQNAALDTFMHTVETMRCCTKNSMQEFQKGIVMSTKSIKNLLVDVRSRFGMTYLLTHRLNQDALENTFSQLRTNGGLNDHPTPLNALYRLRMIILGKNAAMVQNNLNTEDKTQDEYLLATVLRRVGLASENFDDRDPDRTAEESEQIENTVSSLDDEPSPSTEVNRLSETEGDGLAYIAGWIAKKHKSSHPELGDYTYRVREDHTYALPSWIQQLSYGGLIEPSPEWCLDVSKMDKYFLEHHGDSFVKGRNVVKNLTDQLSAMFPSLDKDVIKTFAKIRTIIRLRFLNQVLIIKAKEKIVERLKMAKDKKRRLEDDAKLTDEARKRNTKIRKIVT